MLPLSLPKGMLAMDAEQGRPSLEHANRFALGLFDRLRGVPRFSELLGRYTPCLDFDFSADIWQSPLSIKTDPPVMIVLLYKLFGPGVLCSHIFGNQFLFDWLASLRYISL